MKLKKKLFIRVFVISIFVSVFYAILFLNGVIAASISPTTVSVLEDTSRLYNVTVNTSLNEGGQLSNITQINITLPSSFTFTNETANQTFGPTTIQFVNTSTVLSWINSSAGGILINGSNSSASFWFNASGATPGTYNFSVSIVNVSGISIANVSVTVNDTTRPSIARFVGGTPANNTYLSATSLFLNVSGEDNGVIQNFLASLFNSTVIVVNATNLSSMLTSSLAANFSANFSSLSDGVYFYNVSINDTYNNTNTTETRTFTVDTIFPVPSYGAGTDANNSYLARPFILVNASATETNLNIINISLFNGTGIVVLNNTNITTTSGIVLHNFSALGDGIYHFNVSVNDSANNRNSTLLTRTVTVDTTFPVPSYATGSDGNNSYVPRPFILVNVSVTETNLNIVNVTLFNSSINLNNTNLTTTSGVVLHNLTGLADGVYFYNVSVNDSANNRNSTLATRMVIIDATLPNVTLGVGTNANKTSLSVNSIYVNISGADRNEANVTFTLRNATAVINETTLAIDTRTINWTGLAEGNFTYNVTFKDNASNVNTTVTRSVVLDRTKPSITFSCTPTNVQSDKTITCTCTTTDNLDGDAPPTFTVNPSTANTGTYTTTCSATDDAGNTESKDIKYTVELSTGGGSSGGGGGGSSGAGSAGEGNVNWVKTIVVERAQVAEGVVRSLLENERVRVDVPIVSSGDGSSSGGGGGGSSVHHVGVVSVDKKAKKATIEVSSTPQRVTLSVGESKKFDVTEDNYYDLLVTLNAISAVGRADVTIKSIREEIPRPSESAPVAPPEEEPAEPVSASPETVPQEPKQRISSRGLISLIAFFLIGIGLVIWFIVMATRRKKNPRL